MGSGKIDMAKKKKKKKKRERRKRDKQRSRGGEKRGLLKCNKMSNVRLVREVK